MANFRAAYALYPSPRLLVNAAAAERELGDVAAAANDLSAYLEEPDGDAALTARATAELGALAPTLAKVGLAAGWPSGSQVELDGRSIPSGSWVRPGVHRLRGRAPDGRQSQRTATLVDGDDIRLDLPAATPPKRARGLIAGLVIGGVLLVGAGLGVGLGLGLKPQLPSLATSALFTSPISNRRQSKHLLWRARRLLRRLAYAAPSGATAKNE